MTPELIKTFVTDYLLNLKERTREEAKGVKWGIDWIIYNLGLALHGKPFRLPFLRQASTTAKSKTEAEFGIDVAFLSADGKRLTIFVLKDESLTNKNWIGHGFYEDLTKASAPDLNARGLEAVENVDVILAYNRDEDANGVTLFDRFVANAAPTLAGKAKLSVTRWNLSELVDLVLKHLLTPALLPQRLFGQLNYLCAQVADFPHGSDEWERQLIPGWKRFLTDVLAMESGARGVSLVPVALIILRQHGSNNQSLETGWIDLIEWSALALWRHFTESDDRLTRARVVVFWDQFYLSELDRFYRKHIDALGTPAAIDQTAHASMVGVVAASMVAYWHIARIGLLSVGQAESMLVKSAEEKARQQQVLRETANYMIRLFNANEAALRPILDIHHIEITLVAFTLANANRLNEFGHILPGLIQRLYLRRLEASDIPFLDGYNSLDHVFEQVAASNEEKLITTESSYFVLMLLEICGLLDQETQAALVPQIHRRLVLGAADSGPQRELKPLHLMSWIPPADWDEKVLRGYVDDGEIVSRGPLSDSVDASAPDLITEMTKFVEKMRKAASFPESFKVPMAPLILASIRFKSPLPPEVWRTSAFPRTPESDSTAVP